MFLGADVSYINEVEDLGVVFSQNGQPTDPFVILKDNGANIARVRLWHTPTWTAYSNLDDVERTLRRAKDVGMSLLLDFHYSDTWADPAKQIIPAAWANLDEDQLVDALYAYTFDTLSHLHHSDLMPDFVQIGNEINTELLMPGHHVEGVQIRWPRNARLINAGVKAVRDINKQLGTQTRTILHIAQPEFVLWWFDEALQAGVRDFDIIGMSYYPKWSTYDLQEMGAVVAEACRRYGKQFMLVELAYPWTLEHYQSDEHLLSDDCLIEGYPATQEGQRRFLVDVTQTVKANGGMGVIYWEPAWISAPQRVSIWENSTLFDFKGAAHEGIKFFSYKYE
ncbi:MAG: glycosyl hydrolase 53 family protein [Anaerolineae bacterium]|nr:glycosyl hydrolase 53 family protein [Anaerolineae bacterium]